MERLVMCPVCLQSNCESNLRCTSCGSKLAVQFSDNKSKYDRHIKGKVKDGVFTVDVYDVLKAFEVTNPALQHLIKKALCVGIRGHKDSSTDLQDIIDSAIRAKEIYEQSN